MECGSCGAVSDATKRIKREKQKQQTKNLVIVCLTVILCMCIVCWTVFSITVFREQQYALNMQYAGLMEYIAGAEVTTSEYTAQSDGDGSISVAGDGNVTAGGDVNGQ